MAIQENSVENTYRMMRERLHDIVPDVELRYKAELVVEITRLKRERNALILGHNYMEPALFHTVADYRGDSLELCRNAASAQQEIIVFCGVRFMAETAKILNPDKKVLLPSLKAGCSLADSITAADLRKLKERFPKAVVVSYINSYVDVKAESDICCTSGNAAALVAALNTDQIIFVPDEYLAKNVARETGRQVIFPGNNGAQPHLDPEKLTNVIIGWQGKCEVHEKFTVEDIRQAQQQFPDVLVLAHPECSPEVVAEADFSGSTARIAEYVRKSAARRYLILTECGMADNIAAENPEKEMLRYCSVRCPHMNEITLEQTLRALREDRYQIEVAEKLAASARRALEAMLTIR